MEYRVTELAEAADVSVDTVRFYQGKGLLPPPRREGRVALYGEEHLQRLARIRSLQARGLTLAIIGRLVRGELDAADEALAAALHGGGDTACLTLAQVAERSGLPVAVLATLEQEGLLEPRGEGYTQEDVEVARAGRRLLEHGLPLPELLDLARRHHAAMVEVAERAVGLFDDHIRRPLQRSGLDEAAAAARLVDAFGSLVPATATLVSHHFTRTLLAVAQQHLERVGGADPVPGGAVVAG